MRLPEAIKVLKANTMACWWPNPKMGRNFTDWRAIHGEILGHLAAEKARQGIEPDALFFVLDEGDPGTTYYNELAGALACVLGCIQNSR